MRAQTVEDHGRGEEVLDPDPAEAEENTGMHFNDIAERTCHVHASISVNFCYTENPDGKRI